MHLQFPDVISHLSFMCNFYRPQRSCEGYVFTGVCLSTGEGVCLSALWDTHPPPPEQTPPQNRHPPWSRHPLGADTPESRHPPGADTLQSRHPPGAAQQPRSRHPFPWIRHTHDLIRFAVNYPVISYLKY